MLLLLLSATTAVLTYRPTITTPVGTVSLTERLLSIHAIVGPSSKRDVSINHRYFIWETTWDMICDNPVLGLGYGNYRDLFASYRDKRHHSERYRHLNDIQQNDNTAYAHNEFLHLWAKTGPFSLLAFLTVICLCTHSSMLFSWHSGNLQLLGGLGTLVALLLHSLVSYPLHLPLNSMPF